MNGLELLSLITAFLEEMKERLKIELFSLNYSYQCFGNFEIVFKSKGMHIILNSDRGHFLMKLEIPKRNDCYDYFKLLMQKEHDALLADNVNSIKLNGALELLSNTMEDILSTYAK